MADVRRHRVQQRMSAAEAAVPAAKRRPEYEVSEFRCCCCFFCASRACVFLMLLLLLLLLLCIAKASRRPRMSLGLWVRVMVMG